MCTVVLKLMDHWCDWTHNLRSQRVVSAVSNRHPIEMTQRYGSLQLTRRNVEVVCIPKDSVTISNNRILV